MKAKRRLILPVLLFSASAVLAQNPSLTQVLAQMDKSAAKFENVKANITVDNYTAVVQEHEMQKGWTAFRRVGSTTEMVTHLETGTGQPYADLLYQNGELKYYSPAQNQETILSAGEKNAEANSLLATGFGATGKQLESSWTVKLDGMDSSVPTSGGAPTAKLELVSKDANIRNNYFSKLTIWVDLARDITLKQVTEQPDGDSRTVTYSNVEYNQHLPGSLFTLKVPGNAQVTRR